jgi:hypothetical protein
MTRSFFGFCYVIFLRFVVFQRLELHEVQAVLLGQASHQVPANEGHVRGEK